MTKIELDSLKRQAEKAKEEFENSPECAVRWPKYIFCDFLKLEILFCITERSVRDLQFARTLENKVYKIQANLTEAEHVYSKYKSIKEKLADESHNAQTELHDLLDQIRKQECEIERLKVHRISSFQ